ncbi:MAG: hydrogenase maturation protease [Burkholderiaceae bacterium]|nr:hydrogenase maturation protease [Burkholderiaceae bacterium]
MLSLLATPGVAPTLVLAVGNPSRGDDALGPLAAERIEAMNLPGVEVLVEFQLQVEHALDLIGRNRVLFIDASASLVQPFALAPVEARLDASFTSHALAPSAVLFNYQQLVGTPPPAWLLAIRGQSFELGEALSAPAERALDAALVEARAWLESRAATGAATVTDSARQVAAATAPA